MAENPYKAPQAESESVAPYVPAPRTGLVRWRFIKAAIALGIIATVAVNVRMWFFPSSVLLWNTQGWTAWTSFCILVGVWIASRRRKSQPIAGDG